MIVLVLIVLAAAALVGAVAALVAGGLLLTARLRALGPDDRVRSTGTLVRVAVGGAVGALVCAIAFVVLLYVIPWG